MFKKLFNQFQMNSPIGADSMVIGFKSRCPAKKKNV